MLELDQNATFFLAILEWITIYFLLCFVDGRNRISRYAFVILTVLIAISVFVGDNIESLLQEILISALIVITLKVVNQNKWSEIFTDFVFALSILLGYEICISLIINFCLGDVMQNEKIVFNALLLAAIIAKILNGSARLNYLLERYYRPNRRKLLWIFFCLAIGIVIVIYNCQ